MNFEQSEICAHEWVAFSTLLSGELQAEVSNAVPECLSEVEVYHISDARLGTEAETEDLGTVCRLCHHYAYELRQGVCAEDSGILVQCVGCGSYGFIPMQEISRAEWEAAFRAVSAPYFWNRPEVVIRVQSRPENATHIHINKLSGPVFDLN